MRGTQREGRTIIEKTEGSLLRKRQQTEPFSLPVGFPLYILLPVVAFQSTDSPAERQHSIYRSDRLLAKNAAHRGWYFSHCFLFFRITSLSFFLLSHLCLMSLRYLQVHFILCSVPYVAFLYSVFDVFTSASLRSLIHTQHVQRRYRRFRDRYSVKTKWRVTSLASIVRFRFYCRQAALRVRVSKEHTAWNMTSGRSGT